MPFLAKTKNSGEPLKWDTNAENNPSPNYLIPKLKNQKLRPLVIRNRLS